MLKAGWLRSVWNRVVFRPEFWLAASAFAYVAGREFFHADIADIVWEWSKSDAAANQSNVVMGLAVILAYLEYRRGEERDRQEEADKKAAAAEVLKLQQRELNAKLAGDYRDVVKMFITYPGIDQHYGALKDPQQVQQQRRVYQLLIDLFAEAFGELHDKEDNNSKEQWYAWEDEIDDWVAYPNFRDALPALLRGETDEFIKYIEDMVLKTPVSMGSEVKVPRRKRKPPAPKSGEGPPGIDLP